MTNVAHDQIKHQFFIDLDKDNAHLDYELINNDIVNFTHTYVPFRQRGKGHAEALVEAGLLWAKQQGLQIETSCWYVEKFLANQDTKLKK